MVKNTRDSAFECSGRRGRHRVAHAAAAGPEPRVVESPVLVANLLCLSPKKGYNTRRLFRLVMVKNTRDSAFECSGRRGRVRPFSRERATTRVSDCSSRLITPPATPLFIL
ncbi:hypothetical protein NDU88_004856 [Pleurodeles waltl]|uniref:Uncharacterized protein n=1 Tax=Pleurodeles waltl TaxID=8319 RepID=A0AAV7LAD0_PLEWA|nr:hypothetical protein NDU88_004856 [Pleurodeles waltl]